MDQNDARIPPSGLRNSMVWGIFSKCIGLRPECDVKSIGSSCGRPVSNQAWRWAGAAQLQLSTVRCRLSTVRPPSDHPERAALTAGPFPRPERAAIRQARSDGDLPEPGGGEGADVGRSFRSSSRKLVKKMKSARTVRAFREKNSNLRERPAGRAGTGRGVCMGRSSTCEFLTIMCYSSILLSGKIEYSERRLWRRKHERRI